MLDNQEQTYKNIMEIMVDKEISRQLRKMPSNITKYIDRIQVATYSLNHLPPLYASSAEGKIQQEKKAITEYEEEIAMAVRQGLAAVQRDPLRVSTPLMSEVGGDYRQACLALEQVEEWLRTVDLLEVPQVSWENLLKVIKHAFYKATKNSNCGL